PLIFNVRFCVFFFFQAEDGIRDLIVTGVQTCALPISQTTRPRLQTFGASSGGGPTPHPRVRMELAAARAPRDPGACRARGPSPRSEEHTSELQSRSELVCRLLLEKKKEVPSGYHGEQV